MYCSKLFKTNHSDTLINKLPMVVLMKDLNNCVYSKPIQITNKQTTLIYEWFKNNVKQTLIDLYIENECSGVKPDKLRNMYGRASKEFKTFAQIVLNFGMFYYHKDQNVKSLVIKYNKNKAILRALVVLDLISVFKGYSKVEDGKVEHVTTKIMIYHNKNILSDFITKFAIDDINKVQINHFYLNKRRNCRVEYVKVNQKIVGVKGKTKLDVKPIVKGWFRSQIRMLRDFNGMLNKHTITLDSKYRLKTNISMLNCKVTRVFSVFDVDVDVNDQTQLFGGRFYGHWAQYINKSERRHIKIDNENISELDFSALHANMLYAVEGVEYKGDIYEIDGYQRNSVKLALNIMLNIDDRDKAVNTIHHKIFTNMKCDILSKPQVRNLIKRIEYKHNLLKKYFYDGIWKTTQKMESDMVNNILIQCTEEHIPIIPLHDGFIVKTKDNQKLNNMMIQAYKDVVGVNYIPKISCTNYTDDEDDINNYIF